MTESVDLSIILPALTEEKTLEACLRKVLKTAPSLTPNFEIIVADNGSADRTAEIAVRAGARVVPVKKPGYGNALLGGLSAAQGRWLVMGDADDSYNFEEIGPFVEKLRAGAELVVGNRFLGNIQKGAMPFLHRYLGTPFLTGLMNWVFKTGAGDVNCGMRAMTREAFGKLHLKNQGMEFAAEMLIKGSLAGLAIAEVPCHFYRDGRGRKPHLRTWRDGWRHLRLIFLLAPAMTFLIPGGLLAAAGLAGLALLTARDFFAPQLLGMVNSRHMLSSMLVLLTGSQIVCLGLLARAAGLQGAYACASRGLHFLTEQFRFRRGLCSSFLLMATGTAALGYLGISYYAGFEPRIPELLRFDIAVLAITAVLLSVQILFVSLLLGFLELKAG